MKHFKITSSAGRLTIKRNIAGVIHLRLVLIFSILLGSATIAFLVNRQITHLDGNLEKLALIFAALVGIAVLFFYRDFFKNNFTIEKSGEGYLINKRKELDRRSIEYILEEGYSTKDHIESYRKIRIKTITGVITVCTGINPADKQVITDALLSFFEFDASRLHSRVW